MRYGSSFIIIVLASFGVFGCVELPSEGLTPPDYQAQVRIVVADATMPAQDIVLSFAPGPAFNAYSDVSAGAPLAGTAYAGYAAGGKRVFVKSPQDPDTLTVTFGVETSGTLYVLPRLVRANQRFVYVPERYLYNATGRADTTVVRMLNALSSGDMFNVTTGEGAVVADSLVLGALSGGFAFPAGENRVFYLAGHSDPTPIDSIQIPGESRAVYTIVAYDSLAAGKMKSFREQ
jgi:hypothetical protein